MLATATSDLPRSGMFRSGGTSRSSTRRLILWTVLIEAIGLGWSWGPLAGNIKPMTGGVALLGAPGTIRLRPWRRVPFTTGSRRTWFDVALYVALIVSVIVPLVLPGVPSDSLSAALPDNTSGLVNPALLDRPDGAAGADRAAGQDHLPGRARRAVPAGTVVLHRAARSST